MFKGFVAEILTEHIVTSLHLHNVYYIYTYPYTQNITFNLMDNRTVYLYVQFMLHSIIDNANDLY
jgi:hypothetical protein